jgi:hypothetical protein
MAATAWLFASGRKGKINIRGAFLHMAADKGVAAGVAVAGAVILWTGWVVLDPIVSLGICAVVVWGLGRCSPNRFKCLWQRSPPRSIGQGPPLHPELTWGFAGRLRNLLHDRIIDEWGTNVRNFELVCRG